MNVNETSKVVHAALHYDVGSSFLSVRHCCRHCSAEVKFLSKFRHVFMSRIASSKQPVKKITIHKVKRDPVGWDIFNFVNFENLIDMKLYSLLILPKNTKKSKNNFKAPKKSGIVIFPGRILPCKRNKSAIYGTLHHIFPSLGR